MTLLEFSIFPMTRGESVGEYVARAVEIVRQSGLDYELHAMGTIVEGEMPQLLELLQNCFAALSTDCDRIACTAKFDYRRDRTGAIAGKVKSVQQRLSQQ